MHCWRSVPSGVAYECMTRRMRKRPKIYRNRYRQSTTSRRRRQSRRSWYLFCPSLHAILSRPRAINVANGRHVPDQSDAMSASAFDFETDMEALELFLAQVT